MSRHPLLAGGIVTLLAAVLVALVFLMTPRAASHDTVSSESDVLGQRVRFEGTLKEVTGDTITVDENGTKRELAVNDETFVIRGRGLELFSDHDTARLRVGDDVIIEAEVIGGESLRAETITANSFINRPGIVVAATRDYVDMRLEVDRWSDTYASEPTRVYVASNARPYWLSRFGVWIPAEVQDYPVGSILAVHGYVSDNGEMVGSFFWTWSQVE